MAFLFLRLFLIMETAAVIGYTTQPAELLEGLCKAFHIGNEHAMSILLALGFLPQMSREMNRIRMAQAARGADIRAGSIGKRLKNSMAVVIPLFRLTFERADQMADALDVRCYGAEEERTTRSPLKYGIRDGVCLLYTIFLISGVVITGWIL
jgi:energy-coupling factor transport system permease protein